MFVAVREYRWYNLVRGDVIYVTLPDHNSHLQGTWASFTRYKNPLFNHSYDRSLLPQLQLPKYVCLGVHLLHVRFRICHVSAQFSHAISTRSLHLVSWIKSWLFRTQLWWSLVPHTSVQWWLLFSWFIFMPRLYLSLIAFLL